MRCPDCATEYSALREFCPNCGSAKDPGLRASSRDRLGPRPPEELKRNRTRVLVLGGALVLAVALSGKLHIGPSIHFSRDIVTTSSSDEPKGPVTIAAPDLFEAYHTDSDAAKRRFGGREMVVTGEFLRTVPDGYGSIDMRLKTNHPDLPLGIDLDGHSVDEATRLEPGQNVTVSCRQVAGSGDDPWLQDCVIQPPAEGTSESVPAAAPAAPAPPSAQPPQPPSPPGAR